MDPNHKLNKPSNELILNATAAVFAHVDLLILTEVRARSTVAPLCLLPLPPPPLLLLVMGFSASRLFALAKLREKTAPA